jgi:hypothetical protein
MSKTSIEVLAERVENWMSTTTDYRKELCRKIDIITTQVNGLPCKERGVMYKNNKVTFALLWGAVGITFGLLVSHLGWK